MGFRATNEVAHGGRAVSGRWGVDAGAISTRNTSKGALVVEAHAVFRALASGMALDEVRSACLRRRPEIRESDSMFNWTVALMDSCRRGHRLCLVNDRRITRSYPV